MPAIRETYPHPLNLPGLAEKSIWGPSWQSFMGMATDEAGVSPIGDQPADFTRALSAESYVFRCEDVRGKAISQVPLKAWQVGADGKSKAIEHDALGILAQTNPYGYVDGPALIRYTLQSLDLHGRSAWRLAFNRKRTPSEIYWVIPTQFSPLPDPVKYFRGIRVTNDFGVTEIPPEELCYFATDNPANPLFGTSKIMVLRNAINLRQYSARSNIDFFKNSMRPDLIVTGDWNNTSENMQRLRRSWTEAFAGEHNKSPFFAGNNTKATLLTQTAKDMEWLAQQRLSQEEISACFGVPLIYLNNFDRATYENIKTAKLILWHDTMIPEGRTLGNMFTRQFLWRFWPDSRDRKITLGFDFDEIEGLGEDLSMIWERVRTMSAQISEQVKNRELTPAQARVLRTDLFAHLGVDITAFEGAIPGGETFYETYQLTPIEEHSTLAVIDIMAARGQNAQLETDVPGAPNIGERADDPLPPSNNDTGRPSAAAAPGKGWTQKGPNPVPVREARLAPIHALMVRRLKKHFQNLKNQAEKRLRGGAQFLSAKAEPFDPHADLYDSEQSKEDLMAIVGEGIGLAVASAVAAAREDYELDVKWEGPHLDEYMGLRTALIRGIDENLRSEIRKTLLHSAQAGDSMTEMAAKVRGVFQGAIEHRSETIARTETLQAYAAASIAAYREAGIKQVRMYDGTEFDATCASVNGLVVGLEEAITLMAAEHPNGTRGVAPYGV